MIELPETHYGYDGKDLYTADTVRSLIAHARSDALEEAAKVCDKHEYYGYPMAKEIRALKEKQE